MDEAKKVLLVPGIATALFGGRFLPPKEPPPPPVTWSLQDAIHGIDQYRIARAVEKRLKRALKGQPSAEARHDLVLVRGRLREWRAR